jgi:fatty acid desaturase
MTTVQPHSREAAVQLRRSLLEPTAVRELSRLRPGRVVRDTALCWIAIVAALACAAAVSRWWSYGLAALVVGNRYYALYIIGHDGLHRRLFPDRDRNDLYCDLFVLGPIGAITRINGRNHLRHHQLLGSDADPDRHRHGCLNKTTRAEVLAYALALSSVTASVRNVFSGTAADHDDVSDAPAREARGYRLRDAVILLGWQIALFAGLSLTIGWWAYFLLWWLPVFALAFLADNFRSFVEHSHPEADATADHHRLVTMDPGWLERQVFAPMSMNHHAVHHLWPSIPYYNLAAAEALVSRHPGAAAIERRRSYLGYALGYVRALPIPGCGDRVAVG